MRDIDTGLIITPETAGLVAAHNIVLDSQKHGGELEERAVLDLAKRLADAPIETMQAYFEIAKVEL